MSIFGKEKRSKEIIEETPGPGQYHIPCSIVDVNNYTRKKQNMIISTNLYNTFINIMFNIKNTH